MVQGESNIKEASLSMCPSPLLQSSHLLKRENVGSVGSCNLLCKRGDGPQGDIIDGMEVVE